MKITLALCLVAFAVSVNSESCTSLAGCKETTCHQDHGWWLHCTSGKCLCSHDSYTGADVGLSGLRRTVMAVTRFLAELPFLTIIRQPDIPISTYRKPCANGDVAACQAAHGNRCQTALGSNYRYHCVDNVCHCAKV